MLERGVKWHEHYGLLDRISCSICVLARREQLQKSARLPENFAACMAVIALELETAFSFQEGCWLADLVPEFLDAGMRAALAEAKERARQAGGRGPNTGSSPLHQTLAGGRADAAGGGTYQPYPHHRGENLAHHD